MLRKTCFALTSVRPELNAFIHRRAANYYGITLSKVYCFTSLMSKGMDPSLLIFFKWMQIGSKNKLKMQIIAAGKNFMLPSRFLTGPSRQVYLYNV